MPDRVSSWPLRAVCLAVMFSLGATTLAQNTPQQQTVLTSLKFMGLDRYSEQRVVLASLLKVGDPVSVAQVQSASDRLAQSGAFDKISFRYATRGAELSVEFQVTETKDRLPCVFDNFVWFTNDQLDQTLRARVPLYDGTVPERGTTTHDVSDALQAMLRSNGINGTVDGLPTTISGSDKVVNFAYRVDGVSMPVRSIHIPGASAIPEAELVAAAKELIDKDYSATDAGLVSASTLVAIYHRHGYLQAHFDPARAAVVADKHTGAAYDIALTIPVDEGLQFFWDHASWTGNQKLSTDDLNGLLAMKPHEVANEDKINLGLKAISTAYSKQGYIDAVVLPRVSLDPSARLASYDNTVDEGIQYKMGLLHITGLADKTAADLLKKWQIKPGEIYDATYADDFLKKTAFPKIMESGRPPASYELKLQRDKGSATVDLTLAFR
jgi:outer membrane protein assembly factor BamA